MRSATFLALAASLSSCNAVFQGFNYASTKTDGSPMMLQDWQDAFKAQADLEGTSGGFTSARLYTMIDAGSSTNEPIMALKAAQEDKTTSLLLGMWCSAGQAAFDGEIAALKSAIEQYPDLGSQIAGISVGSEDLYRNSNIANETTPSPGPGVNPDVVLSYIQQVKDVLNGPWSDVKVGHVDTWTAFTNDDGSFDQGDLTSLIGALDFVGVDAYPYFQNTMPNGIEKSTELFDEAFQKVVAVAGDAEVWITETGWPVTGETIRDAVPSRENAQTYWQNVGCPNFGKVNTWWYTYDDSTSTPSFGVVNSLTGGTPNWDLSCSELKDLPDATKPSDSRISSSNTTSGAAAASGSMGGQYGTNSSFTSSPPSNPGSEAGSSNADNESGGVGVTPTSFLALAGGLLIVMTLF